MLPVIVTETVLVDRPPILHSFLIFSCLLLAGQRYSILFPVGYLPHFFVASDYTDLSTYSIHDKYKNTGL